MHPDRQDGVGMRLAVVVRIDTSDVHGPQDGADEPDVPVLCF